MGRYKIQKILLILTVSIPLLFLTSGKAFSQLTLPTITMVCEDKSGVLYAFDDGFSLFKKCAGKGRRVILIGEKGDRGDKGDKGEQGLQGTMPTAVEHTIFAQGYLTNDSYSDIKDFTGHQMLTLNCVFTYGIGGVWVYYSEDQINWNLDPRAECGGNSNNGDVQKDSKIKGNFYKFKIIGNYDGQVSAIVY